MNTISGLGFDPANPQCLVSGSYDGSLRSFDMVKGVFEEVHNHAYFMDTHTNSYI